jgi:hypothetical protein
MEYDMMSASFAFIRGKMFNENENREKGLYLSSEVPHSAAAEAEPTLGKAVPIQVARSASSARESFLSIVNASTCANAKGEEILKSYLTLAKQASFLRSYMY